jgi:predicted DNA-binding protein
MTALKLKLPIELKTRLSVAADKLSLPASALVRLAVIEHLEKLEAKTQSK